MSASPWRTLGIQPTSDRKEIRSAYARKLKSGAFDTPDAFERLRHARDHALALADDLPAAPDPSATPSEDAAGTPFAAPVLAHDGAGITAHVPSPDDLTLAPLSAGFAADQGGGAAIEVQSPALGAPIVAGHEDSAAIGPSMLLNGYQQHCSAIYQLLHDADREQLLDEGERATLDRDFEAAARFASQESIEQQGDFEIWMAEVVAQTLPRSEPALDAAARHFGWVERAQMIDAPPTIAWLGQRMAAMDFIGQLENPKHRWHRAYRELRTPAGEHSRRGRFIGSRKVRDLLTYVRNNQPMVEQTFDTWRVGLWDQAASTRQSWVTWLWIAFVVFNVIRVVTTGPSSSPSVSPPPPVQTSAPLSGTPEEAIAPVLLAFGNPELTVTTLKTRNPALFTDLVNLWEQTYAAKASSWDYRAMADKLIRDRAERALATASYDISHQRIVALRSMAEAFYKEHPQYCADFLDGKTMTDEWLTPYRVRYRRIMTAALLDRSTPATLPERKPHFTIPGPMMEDIVRRTHLTDDVVRLALRGKSGNSDQICRVQLALMDSALAAKPAVGLPVLQGL